MHVTETPWIHLGLEEDWETYDDEQKDQSEAGVFEKELVREADLVLDQARLPRRRPQRQPNVFPGT